MFHKILLINPYSSSAYLDKNFRAHEVHTTAIFTTENLSDFNYFTPPPNLFNKQLFMPNATCEQVISAMGDEQFDYVINGSEVSLLLTDQLAHHYTPELANDPKTYMLRFNKHLMHEQLAKQGLAHIHQVLFNSTQDDLNSVDIKLPCFVKPLVGGGSIGAKKILTQDELAHYFDDANISAIGAKNKVYKIGESDSQFLIAELLEGNEYFVDSFSIQGTHYLSSVQSYTRKFINNVPVALYSEIVHDSHLSRDIVAYIFDCLSALGINNGFAHTDLFVTQEGEIKFVEVNSRIAGVKGASNSLAALSRRPSQIDLLLSHLYPDKLTLKNQISEDYFTRINVYNAHAFNSDTLNTFKTIKATFRTDHSEDKKIEHAVSLTDIVGFILCSSPRQEELHEEVIRLSQLVV